MIYGDRNICGALAQDLMHLLLIFNCLCAYECAYLCLGNGRGGESIYGGFFEGKPSSDTFCSLLSIQ